MIDACEKVGISETSYYNWRKRGKDEIERRNLKRPNAKLNRRERERREREEIYVEFVEATTRAIAEAKVNAAIVFRQGMLPADIVTETTETVSETRLDKDGKPYQYTRTVTRRQVTHQPGDWRAAVEYLERRDPANWSKHTVLRGADAQGRPGPIPITFVRVAAPVKEAMDEGSDNPDASE